MKKRIIALILTVVMSLLALSSCNSGFDFATEDLSGYAKLDVEKFLQDLQKLEIEDGDFTTNKETRDAFVAATVYNAIVDKVLAEKTAEEDQLKEGELGAGDVLYFVYYAVDENDNVYFGSDMNKSSITLSSTKANHVVRLGDKLDDKGDEIAKLIVENLQKGDIKDYIYSMSSVAELQNKAVEDVKAANPDKTEEELKDEIAAAKAEAIKIKAGDKVYITYTRTYTKKDAEGVETKVEEKAAYEYTTIDPENNRLHELFFAEGSVANYGSNVTAKDAENKNSSTLTVKDGDITYTYTNVKALWKVESEGKAIATFKYTPYDDDTKQVMPDSLHSTATKENLGKKELTYYVFPTYYIEAPSYEEITAVDILYYLNGSKLTADSYEALDVEGYKNGEETLEDLLKDITLVTASSDKDNKFYKEGELKTLLDAYNDAVKAGGSKPTDAQKKVIDEARAALTKGQNAKLKEVITKIAGAKKDDKVLGTEVLTEYVEDTFHTLKEAYDSDITSKVQKAVLDLIYESVTITGYPEKLLEEFIDHVYESYEYDFHTGYTDDKKTDTNYNKYGDLDTYLEAKLGSNVDAAIEKEAKGYLDPILKVFYVSQVLNNKAVAAMPGYVQADIDGGAYNIDEEAYRDYYKEDAQKYIDEAKAKADENKQSAIDEATKFLINDDYMKAFKKEVGSSYYRTLVETYGETNLRTGMQFNKLFYYLTSTNIFFNEDEGHAEIKYTEDGTKLDFRTVDYTIKVENDEADTDK